MEQPSSKKEQDSFSQDQVQQQDKQSQQQHQMLQNNQALDSNVNQLQKVDNQQQQQQNQDDSYNQDDDEQQYPVNNWVVQLDEYKNAIRQNLGNNKSNKPKMPLVFYDWSQEHQKKAEQMISEDQIKLDGNQYQKYELEAHKFWDTFYKHHKSKFFHNRHYLRREFPELVAIRDPENRENNYVLCELGCGVGDTIFPLKVEYPNLFLEACDFSAKAIETMKLNPEFDTKRMAAAVVDLVLDPFPPNFLQADFVTLIFCLSAISPENHQRVIQKIFDWMKPGAIFYIRDYGRYDFAQLNFSKKGGRKLKDNFYAKQDGTRVYYFEEKEITQLCTGAGFQQLECKAHHRYLENRKTGLEMYRVWVQGRYKKPDNSQMQQQQNTANIQQDNQQEEHKIGEQKEEQNIQQTTLQNQQKSNDNKDILQNKQDEATKQNIQVIIEQKQNNADDLSCKEIQKQ